MMPANPKMETNPMSFFILHHSLMCCVGFEESSSQLPEGIWA